MGTAEVMQTTPSCPSLKVIVHTLAVCLVGSVIDSGRRVVLPHPGEVIRGVALPTARGGVHVCGDLAMELL